MQNNSVTTFNSILDTTAEHHLCFPFNLFYFFYKEKIEQNISNQYFEILGYTEDNKSLYLLYETLWDLQQIYSMGIPGDIASIRELQEEDNQELNEEMYKRSLDLFKKSELFVTKIKEIFKSLDYKK